MVKRSLLIFVCLLSALAVLWGEKQVLAQTQGMAYPRKSHDVDYIKQRRAGRLTLEQRQAAAERYAAQHAQTNALNSTANYCNTVTDQSGRGN